MCEIYKKGLLPTAQRRFPDGPSSWHLQEDNDPKHTCQLATQWKAEDQVQVLPWPACSPDQNPIVNVWSIMEMKISQKTIRTVGGLRRAIKEAWKSLPTELAVKLVDSTKSRVECLIEAKGDYIFY